MSVTRIFWQRGGNGFGLRLLVRIANWFCVRLRRSSGSLLIPGTFIYDFAFQVILFTGISSFLINMNPLIKLDGYYALMDSLEIPELREESFAHINRRIKKMFGLNVDEVQDLTRRKKRIYWIYGTLSDTLYSHLILRNCFLVTKCLSGDV